MRTTVSIALRLAVVAVLALAAGTASGASDKQDKVRACVHQRMSGGYGASVRRALTSGKDVWGNALLRSPSGPTYEGAARRLRPLLLAAHSTRRYLTESGIYYIPFGWPTQF